MTITGMTMIAVMAAAAQAGQPQQKVTVYLHDDANAYGEVLIPAKALASRMFAGIGISLEWNSRQPAASSTEAPIIIELVTGTPLDRKPGALAYATLHEDVHIIVFYDRIAALPMRNTVLAHVMVHEITHILQGVSRHSGSGVMKAHWTGNDFGTMQCKPLAFTAEDVTLIYCGLSARRAGGDTRQIEGFTSGSMAAPGKAPTPTSRFSSK